MKKRIFSILLVFILLFCLSACKPGTNTYSNSVAVYADDEGSLYLYNGKKSIELTDSLFKTDSAEDLPAYKISPEQFCFYAVDANRIFYPERVFRQSGVTVINLCMKNTDENTEPIEIAQNVLSYVAGSNGDIVAYQTTNKGFFATFTDTKETVLVTKATVSDYCISDTDTSLYYIFGGKLYRFADSKVDTLFAGNATKILCARGSDVFFEAKVDNVPRLFVYNGSKCISLVNNPSAVCTENAFYILTNSGDIYTASDLTEFSDLQLKYTGAHPGTIFADVNGNACYVRKAAPDSNEFLMCVGENTASESFTFRSIKYIAEYDSVFIIGDTSVKTCKNNVITTVSEWPKDALEEDGFEGFANYFVTEDGTIYFEQELLDLYDEHYGTNYYVVKMGVKNKIKEIYGRFAYLSLPVCDPSVTVPVK